MLKKYNRGASKDVYNIYTSDESLTYAYKPETKQQSTVWVFQDGPNPTKVIYAWSTLEQMIVCFFGTTGHVATISLEQRRPANSECYTTISLWEMLGATRKKKAATEDHSSSWQRKLTHRLKQPPIRSAKMSNW